jgi:predicted P-loop ATPase
MQRAEVERTKAALSRCVDHYRPSFGHYSRDFPRRNGFAGTTNHDAYLLDDTGNRRIWGVKVGTILLDAIERDRDQLWAEAVHAYQAGERGGSTPPVEARRRPSRPSALEEDSWTHDVVTWGQDPAPALQRQRRPDQGPAARRRQQARRQGHQARRPHPAHQRLHAHRTKTARLWSKPAPDTAPNRHPRPSPKTLRYQCP